MKNFFFAFSSPHYIVKLCNFSHVIENFTALVGLNEVKGEAKMSTWINYFSLIWQISSLVFCQIANVGYLSVFLVVVCIAFNCSELKEIFILFWGYKYMRNIIRRDSHFSPVAFVEFYSYEWNSRAVWILSDEKERKRKFQLEDC